MCEPSAGEGLSVADRTRFLAVLALVSAAALGIWGLLGSSGPSTTPFARSGSVVIVSVPGLRWEDLAATSTPSLDELLGATGLLSVRAVGPTTSPAEGYLTLGAGNRIEPDDRPIEVVDGRCVPSLVESGRDSAARELTGAEPGALGSALRRAGVATAVHGSPAAIAALMDVDGCVDEYDTTIPTEVGQGVTLIEFGGLEATDVATERRDAIAAMDRQLAALSLPGNATVLLVAPAAPLARAEVTVAAVRGSDDTGSDDTGSVALTSPTTRRADYVTLSDIAPTALAVLGVDQPSSMNGTVMAPVDGSAASSTERVEHLADLAARVRFRDRAVGPVSAVLVTLVTLAGMAALGQRDRVARMLAPVAAAFPTVVFLSGLTAYHRVPLGAYVVLLVATAMCVGAVASSTLARFGDGAAGSALGALLWVLLVVDVATGGRLQINTPFGYTPTIAGRFQGFGNLAFGLFAAAALVVACAPIERLVRRTAVVWAAWAMLVSLVIVAAPAFGSDVGGTLALAPTLVLVVLLVAGRRVSWRWMLGSVVSAFVLVAGLAVLDLQRPASERTHLGRFLRDLLDGDGGRVLRRKLQGNLEILTASAWPVLLFTIFVAAGVLAWRRRAAFQGALADHESVPIFVRCFATVGVLGFVLNDSGIAVPAAMITVGVPWLIAMLVPRVVRERG